MCYRTKLPIMVLPFLDNYETAVPIPAGTAFEAVGLAQDDRFAIVSIRGEQFLVFDSDLKQCETVSRPFVEDAEPDRNIQSSLFMVAVTN
jgi:hypothetical protein